MKTRLGRAIGPEAAAALYRAFARDACRTASLVRAAERRLCFAPGPPVPAGIRALLTARQRSRFRLEPQGPGDLGERLERAAARAFLAGFRRVVLIGSDAPLLQPEAIDEALAALGTSDVVLGPATDGGYYLLGLRRPAPSLFRGIPWSTGAVLRATLRQARRARLRVRLLSVLSDVDRLADLEALHRLLEQVSLWRELSAPPRATRRAMRDTLSQSLFARCQKPNIS